MREVLKRIIALYDQSADTPQERVDSSRRLLWIIKDILGDEQSLHAMMLMREIDRVEGQSDGLLFHELLNPDADGIFEVDFRAQAAKHGLTYVAEAQIGRTIALWAKDLIPADAAFDAVARADKPPMESILSCLFPAAIRGSLICRAEAAASKQVYYEVLERMSFLSLVGQMVDGQKLPEGMFVRAKGAPVEVQDRRLTALLEEACRSFPRPLSFAAIAEIEGMKDIGHEDLQRLIFNAMLRDYLDFFIEEPNAACLPGTQPAAFAFARYEAQYQDWVTNLRHEFVPLNEFQRKLLPLLDGNRSAVELGRMVIEMIEQGTLSGAADGMVLTAQADWQKSVREEIESSLTFFAQSALLLGLAQPWVDAEFAAATLPRRPICRRLLSFFRGRSKL
jgi:methyltransferase-like protein